MLLILVAIGLLIFCKSFRCAAVASCVRPNTTASSIVSHFGLVNSSFWNSAIPMIHVSSSIRSFSSSLPNSHFFVMFASGDERVQRLISLLLELAQFQTTYAVVFHWFQLFAELVR
jgi:hypothetical protein